ncbi:response regulator [Pseudanabaena sp. UWO311]|uniref:ATP-binding response regulator n=2 Tax=Pseudanabaena sp. UWO311 TaxID=2487337 RepID=UPI00115777BF|nr:hybrid sensor histidine kinase/response regulator [Pseudanabaena sp. UWO311]TYQ29458.1 response regulator [Pseudanabaena sp. UWO311]
MDNSPPKPMNALRTPTCTPPLLKKSDVEELSVQISPSTSIKTLTRILIVDDSDIDRDTYIRYLQSDTDYTYEIIEAENLEDGLEMWRSQSPEMVLLDVKLPDGDGLEFLEAFSEGSNEQRLPVIVLTGQGDEQTAVRAMKLGAADYLEKKDVTAVSLCISVGQVRDRIALNQQLTRSQQQQQELLQNLQKYTNQLQKREAELERLSERLTLSLKSGEIGCWEWDLVENTIQWDVRMRELYVVTESSDLDLYNVWTSALHPEDRVAAESSLQQAILEKEKYESEFRIIHPDQSIHFIRSYGTVLRDSEGLAQRIIGINFNVSDRKEVEEQLLQTNEQLIKATRLKDEFLANMSHELRTPLTAVLGMSEILQKEMLGSINERQQKALIAIRKGGRHLLELINDILDLSKISSGKVELDLESVSVQNVCDSSLVYVKQQAFQNHVEVYSNIAPNISNILVDERRLRQILINLLVNAVKFTPKNGKVSLLVSVGCGETWEGEATVPNQLKDQDLPMILFQVTDTGIGIASRDLHRLFQPFVQLDSGLNRQYEGTGLGLVMVKQIAELHDGQVMVTSVIGQGSTFTVALPYQMSEFATRSPELITPFSLTTAKSKHAIAPLILLVEDNEANIQTFTSYLSAYEYQVVLAKNGEEGVAMAKTHQPDIILMDIQMPVMDGLQATRLIRAEPKLATVPIIALTARAMQGDQELCIKAGANQYLSKPVELEQLVGVIGQFLEM